MSVVLFCVAATAVLLLLLTFEDGRKAAATK